MATVTIDRLRKLYGDVVAVDDLSLHIPDGSFVAILGPSGCGKTTTMNVISGLDAPTSGRVLIGDVCVNDYPQGARSIGFVFQNWAVFRHMTVAQNLEYGLRALQLSRRSRQAEVRRVAALLQLGSLLEASAARLSANEAQLVALGRTIITRPSIFLLDEPFSNLDSQFRSRMRVELKRLQRELGQTMIYVTHDQTEAISMADEIAVMRAGVLQQFSAPAVIFDQPANRFVAEFIGDPPMNVIDGVLAGANQERCCLHGHQEIGIGDASTCGSIAEGEPIGLGIRPEDVEIAPHGSEPVEASVDLIERLGRRTIVHLRLGQIPIRVVAARVASTLDVGDLVSLRLRRDRLHVFDGSGGCVHSPAFQV